MGMVHKIRKGNTMKKTTKIEKINWEKVVKYGVALGWMASTLYLLLLIAAKVTA